MFRFLLTLFVTCLILPVETTAFAENPKADRITVSPADWPWWRGPNRNGVAAPDQILPLEWSKSKNVLWKSPVPGRGHSSPTVVGNQIFLTTADEKRGNQSVLCYDRQTGKQLWQTIVHSGHVEKKGNQKSTQASSSVACDGTRIFINFVHDGAAYTTALSRDGKHLWQTKITDYVIHQGYGSSPALYGSLVIVSADNKGEGGGAIAALERGSGKFVWKHSRPATANYASPIILNVAGREQLLFSGCNLVSGYEPATGKKLWEIKGSTTECVTSTVTDGELIFTSGGYPKNHTAAVRADGSGEIVWENTTRVYVPSMLVHNRYLYAVLDTGIAVCWKSDTGKEVWKSRLSGTFSSSPVLAGKKIFVTNEKGTTFIFKANPKKFELIGKNKLGNEVFATPTICGSRIYFRVAEQTNSQRQEMLYCLGLK